MSGEGIPGGHVGEDGVVEDGLSETRAVPPRRWPALRIVAAVRMAFDGRKLIIAAAGLLSLQLGWSLLDRAFPDSAALTPDLAAPEADNRLSADLSWTTDGPPGRLFEPARNLIGPLLALLNPGSPWSVMLHALLAIAWLIVVWGYFGGAIARIAASQEAQARQPGIGEALRFAKRSAPSLILTPVYPLAVLWFCSLTGVFFGLVYRIPAGPSVAGVLLFIPLLAGLLMTLLAVALIAGWPFFHAALASGADDSLDALSRTYSYLNQRLIFFILGIAIAWAAGLAGLALIDGLAAGVLRLTQWSLSLSGPPSEIAALFGRSPAGTPPDAASLGPVAVAAHRTWLGVVRFLAHAWIYSYFWSAATLIYLWLRHEVDGTPSTLIDSPGTSA